MNLSSFNSLNSLKNLKLLFLLFFIILILFYFFNFYIKRNKLNNKIKIIIKKRKQITLENIQNKLKLPNYNNEKILNMNINELKYLMNNNQLNSIELISLYIQRCITIGNDLNAITQDLYLEALEMAKLSDERRLAGKPIRLLEGIPFSVKDCFDQKGMDSTCGLASRVGQASQRDCPIIQMLKNEGYYYYEYNLITYLFNYLLIYMLIGGIPIVRSNVPPILMAWETSNNVFGTTLNPWNPLKITGGSSGGEAALISSRCSPIGIGTDIGGSLRIPAACCGIYSFKPTTKRLTTKYVSCQEVPGQTAIYSSPGPMGRYVDDLELLMKIWLQPKHQIKNEENNDNSLILNRENLSNMWYYDPYTPPVPWRNTLSSSIIDLNLDLNSDSTSTSTDVTILNTLSNLKTSSRRIRIGYFRSNSFFQPATCCQRALDEVINTLKEEGFEVIEWSPPSLSFMKAGFLANRVFIADRCKWLKSVLGDEFPHYTMLGGIILGSIPPFILYYLGKILQCFPYTTRLGRLLNETFGCSYSNVSDVWQLNYEIQEYQQQFHELFQLSKLNYLICPTMGLPAVNHKESINLLPVVMYTSIFNVLQYPVGHIPVTTVKENECYYHDKKWENDIITNIANKQMKSSKGLPVGVSIAGLPYDDESVINLMKILEKRFKFQSSK